MLRDFDMELVLHQNFYDFFHERRSHGDDAHLLYRMQAFDKTSVSLAPSVRAGKRESFPKPRGYCSGATYAVYSYQEVTMQMKLM